jgi:GAF domain
VDSQTQFETDSAEAAANTAVRFSALIQTATVEFLSSAQLLAERARFLSHADGLSIALKQGSRFVYCASAGTSDKAGTPADALHAPVATCIAAAQPISVSTHTLHSQLVKVAIPILREHEVVGFFELSANRSSFSQEDIAAVSAIAEMVNTAIDHMEAAENAQMRILESRQPAQIETASPHLWHAGSRPEVTSKADSAPIPAPAPLPLKVHVCQSCGFPVSEGRKLCVECEQDPRVPHLPEPPLLAVEPEQSWIVAHGYTVASLLVTALVAGIIYWLR